MKDKKGDKRYKLNFDTVNEIRRIFREENISRTNLSRKFSVSYNAIKTILRNKHYYDENYSPPEFSSKEYKIIENGLPKKIRDLFANGNITKNDLGKMFNIDRQKITKIIQNKIFIDESYVPPLPRNMSSKFLTSEQRFWKYVKKIKDEDKCWLWTGVKNPSGYGKILVNKRIVSTHRFSWALHNGEIPNEMFVLHTCDVRNCVNPKHLYLGTDKENNEDKVLRQRQPRGEAHFHSVLTEDQVKEIKQLKLDGLGPSKIYEKFYSFCSKSCIEAIFYGRTWKYIP